MFIQIGPEQLIEDTSEVVEEYTSLKRVSVPLLQIINKVMSDKHKILYIAYLIMLATSQVQKFYGQVEECI